MAHEIMFRGYLSTHAMSKTIQTMVEQHVRHSLSPLTMVASSLEVTVYRTQWYPRANILRRSWSTAPFVNWQLLQNQYFVHGWEPLGDSLLFQQSVLTHWLLSNHVFESLFSFNNCVFVPFITIFVTKIKENFDRYDLVQFDNIFVDIWGTHRSRH